MQMDMDRIRKKHTPKIILLFVALILSFPGCKKDEDQEQERKDAVIQDLNSHMSADSLETYVIWLTDLGTRFALADNHRNVAVKIRNRFVNIGYSDARLDSFVLSKVYKDIAYQQWQYNVIASLEGKNNPATICVMGGHYDDNLRTGDTFSVVPGANDNASGVAATLEVARVMKKNNFVPENTIQFIAFGSEELGLNGSSAYVTSARQNLKEIKLMLNNDMVAYQPGTNTSDWKVNILDYDNSHELRQEAEQMCTRYSVLKYVNDNTYNRQSDSYPFFAAGYKAIFFFSDIIDEGYHSLSDLPANCNFEYCREIAKVCCAVLVNNN
jgi:hypothetical protein